MTRSFTLAAALVLAGAALAQDLAFTNARVFDGSELLEPATVVVRDGRVAELGADLAVPAGVEAVDVGGGTLLPGLFDAHVHTFTPDALRQNLVFGVTTVLDMFTDPGFAAGLRAGQPATDRADLFSAGVLGTVADGHGTQFGLAIPTLAGPEDAAAWVEARVAEGSDFVKVVLESGEELGAEMPTLDDATLRAVIDEAHARDLLVVTHVQTLAAARQALAAGTDGLAHMFVDAVPDDAFVEEVAAAGVFVIPTLSVFQTIGGEPVDASVAEDPELRPYLAQADLQNLAAPFPGFEGLAFANALEGVRRFHAAGVPILAGTDAMNPGVVYGASLHRELELLVEAGLAPREALAAATSVPARVFGLEARGRIAPGALADLVLVEGDPTREITATRRIAGVWKAGVRADRDAWSARIAAQEEAARAQAEAFAAGGPVPVSDFEDGTPSVATGQPWAATTDVQAGGDSTAAIEVVPGGADGSAFALRVAGEVGDAFALPWAGAMYMPGATPFGPVDLSGAPVLRFAAAGAPGAYRVQLFCANAPQMPIESAFEVGEAWAAYEVDLAEAGCDVTGVMAVIFSAGAPGPFELRLDDVAFAPRD